MRLENSSGVRGFKGGLEDSKWGYRIQSGGRRFKVGLEVSVGLED